jgi:tetratricopeptide (TPR) repeat protein
MRRAGQLDQAIFHLNEAVGLSPNNMDPYLELGQAYQERREYKQALKIYQRAINVAGGDYRPYYQAGLVLKDSKDYLAAEAMLRRAAQLAPNEVSIHRLLGAVVALNLVHNRRLSSMDVPES